MMEPSDLDYHRRITDAFIRARAAMESWMAHVIAKYDLTAWDAIDVDGTIRRGGDPVAADEEEEVVADA